MTVDKNRYDYTVAIAKGVLGTIPYIGSLLEEIAGTFIPNQRLDRITDFVKKLCEKIAAVSMAQEELRKRLTSPESIDLFEDSAWQAVRALSDERRDYIASLLKNSLTADQLEYISYKQLLSILGELNDIEILILKSYSFLSLAKRGEFLEKHKEALHPRHAHLTSSHDEIDEATVYESYTDHLKRMQLLRDKPVTDITALGRLLLHSMDQFE
jgi:hypothetical protein